MSEENKKIVEVVKKTFEVIKETSKEMEHGAKSFDKELSTKIQKVKESADEVVKHIEKKSG